MQTQRDATPGPRGASGTPGAPRRPGPRVRTSLVVLIAGVVVAASGAIGVMIPVFSTILAPSYTVPGTLHLHLARGKYMVFERTGSTTGAGPLTFRRDDGVTIDADQVRVITPAGGTLSTSNVTVNETISRGSRTFTAAVEFRASASGDYELRFATAKTEVIVTRPLGETLRSRLGWLAAGLAGALVAVGGAAMLGTGALRRRRFDRAHASVPAWAVPGPLPPPGWFPDPYPTGRLRYWDGTRWTEHLH